MSPLDAAGGAPGGTSGRIKLIVTDESDVETVPTTFADGAPYGFIWCQHLCLTALHERHLYSARVTHVSPRRSSTQIFLSAQLSIRRKAEHVTGALRDALDVIGQCLQRFPVLPLIP